MSGPALGVLEIEHIARGIAVSDALCKRAEVLLLAARPLSGGRYVIWLRGEVAEVEEAMDAATERAGQALVDSLFLPMAHDALWPAIPDPVVGGGWDAGDQLSVLILETGTICALLGAADAALKIAPVALRDVRLGIGISGKAFFTMTGELFDLEAARDIAQDRAGSHLLSCELIPAPAGEIAGRLVF
jgi:microcompartment protein CcmL/EutN